MKTCTKCHRPKQFTEFSKDSRVSDGYQYWCKPCQRDSRDPSSYPARMRLAAIQRLGAYCVRCKFSDIRALQIDHINGGGSLERKQLTATTVYRKISEGFTEGYQVLCANCNWIKRAENQEAKGRPRIEVFN